VATDRDERFQQLSRLFDQIVETPPEEREEAIRAACAGDAVLERELRQLLRAHDSEDSDGYLQGLIAAEATAATHASVAGRRLGSWEIERPIGEGGMGTVYLAHRADGEYEATAAIKLVRGGVPSALLQERMRSERQILAGLSHPGVAQLLDGGTTDDGTPYLVLEYVDGRPITKWCDERDLDVEERLRLFLKVCDAVAYAHNALVAHRDLKPSNILVTEDGEAKLLDFGIAKLVDSVSEASQGVTQTYGILTPAYASPEQVVGERAGVAADIYSLGVLLFELLTGHLPIETSGLTPVQLVSKVTTEVPPSPSSVMNDPGRRRRVAGDLDAIVSRALRKEPELRYESVGTLAEDIRLHLDGRPIQARNDDFLYRTRKLVRRNRGTVSGGVLLLIVGISFTINTVVQARAVARERDRTEAERQTAVRVSAFLEELFTEADPNETTDRDITARELLDRGAERVLGGLEEDPDVQAALATVIGRVYQRLGEYDAAKPLLDSALAYIRRNPDVSVDERAEVLIESGALAYTLGDYERSLELAQEALSLYEPLTSDDLDPRLAQPYDWIAASLNALGRPEEAEPYGRRQIEILRSVDPEPNGDLSAALTSYTDILRPLGRYDEAVEIGREALAMARQVYGNEHLEVAFSLNQLVSSLRGAGRSEEALPLAEEGLAIRRLNFAGPNVEVAASLGNVANVNVDLGRMDEAERYRRESYEMLTEIFPEPHPYTAAVSNSMGGLLRMTGKYDEAEPYLLASVELSRAAFPEGHPNIALPLVQLGLMYLEQARYAEAERVLRDGYDIQVAGLPADSPRIAETRSALASALDGLGRAEDAARLRSDQQ